LEVAANVNRDKLKNPNETGNEELRLMRGKNENAEEATYLRHRDAHDEKGECFGCIFEHGKQ
jgi:hypothetical protein